MYIFLDVDGVLNKKSDWTRPFSLNPECVKNFVELIGKIPDAKIVLSSTWRNGIARDGSRTAHVEDLMSALSSVGINTIDRTANAPDGGRSKEIEYYLRRHEVDSYIILDDDPNLFDAGRKTKNLYVIDSEYGVQKDDIIKISKRIGLR